MYRRVGVHYPCSARLIMNEAYNCAINTESLQHHTEWRWLQQPIAIVGWSESMVNDLIKTKYIQSNKKEDATEWYEIKKSTKIRRRRRRTCSACTCIYLINNTFTNRHVPLWFQKKTSWLEKVIFSNGLKKKTGSGLHWEKSSQIVSVNCLLLT